MPAAPPVPKNGAVAYGSYTADFASFDVSAGQAIDNVTPYGSSIICAQFVGSGTPSFAFNIGAFALNKAASTNPDLAIPSSSTTIFTSGGATMTLTIDTGCTYSCTAILGSFRLGHARMRGYVPVAMSLANYQEVTEAWALS